MIPQEVKEEFLRKLEEHTVMYMVAGSNIGESPMWFQLSSVKDSTLTFKSSQNSRIWFAIPVPEGVFEHAIVVSSQAYDYFRDLKYEYLKNNYPSVYSEIK